MWCSNEFKENILVKYDLVKIIKLLANILYNINKYRELGHSDLFVHFFTFLNALTNVELNVKNRGIKTNHISI